MPSSDLNILAAFLAIAEERSFTKAAKRLGVSPSAMSHAIRGLEETLGVRLLSRTTRSVAPTEAGEQLLVRLRPALTDIKDALNQLSGLRDKPAGRVRLIVPRLAGTTVIGPKLAKFTREYPDVLLEVTADDRRVDIVAGGQDWRAREAPLCRGAGRLNSRLTINAGIRWEPFFPLYTRFNHVDRFLMGNFLAGTKSTVWPNAPAGLVYPGDPGSPGNRRTDGRLNDFAPRLAVSYDPRGKGKEVIRAEKKSQGGRQVLGNAMR